MNVEEFVEGYVKGGKREEYVKKHIVNTYVPIDEKLRVCNGIASATTHTTDAATGKERFSVNTPARFVLFMMTLVNKYTDIDVDFDQTAETFDALDKHGLVDVIARLIDQHEYSTFDTLLKMTVSDIVENERDLVGWLDNMKDAMMVVLAETQKILEAQAAEGEDA